MRCKQWKGIFSFIGSGYSVCRSAATLAIETLFRFHNSFLLSSLSMEHTQQPRYADPSGARGQRIREESYPFRKNFYSIKSILKILLQKFRYCFRFFSTYPIFLVQSLFRKQPNRDNRSFTFYLYLPDILLRLRALW